MSTPNLVEVAGEESSRRETARTNAAGALHRELERRGLVDVGDVYWNVHVARPGRFYATASVVARRR